MNHMLEELVALVQPPLRSASDAERHLVEAAYGTTLPPDFVELATTFPGGTFQTYLRVAHLAEYPSTDELAAALEFYRDMIRDGAEYSGQPIAIYPEPGGLLPWAGIGRDWVICWLTTDPDPARWSVVVCDPVNDERFPYAGTSVAFLRDFVLGRTGIEPLAYIHEHYPTPVMAAITGPPAPAQPAQLYPDGWARVAETVEVSDQQLDAGDQLRTILGQTVSVQPVGVDWHDVETRLGSRVPTDYRRLIDNGAPERVGTVRLAVPSGVGDGALVALAAHVYARMLAAHQSSGGFRGPYHPEPRGLVPWAVADNGAVLCWCPTVPNPDRWPVMIVAATYRANVTYSMTATQLLLRLVTEPDRVVLP